MSTQISNKGKKVKRYNKRTWLNDISSSSTGSVVAFDGQVVYAEDDINDYSFLEISDCKGKITLHRTDYDTQKDFIKKLEKLNKEIKLFINHLNKQ